MQRKISVQNAEWVAFLSLIWNFLIGCLLFYLAYWTHSEAVKFEAWHCLGGVLLWLLLLLHLHQQRLADDEKITSPPSPTGNTLFEKIKQDPFSAQTRLLFFEKWMVPFLTLAVGILQIVIGSALFYDYAKNAPAITVKNAPLSAAFLTGFAFFSLLLSKYALGMARQPVWRLLKAGGKYLFMNAVFCFVCAICVALTDIGLAAPESYLAYIIPVLLVLLGAEMFLNLFLDIYRPRVATEDVHPPYESRLLELITGSKGLVRTLAHTLDYQFGFKVSETWFYHFLEKTIVPLLFFQLLTLYLLTSLVVIRPEEQGIVERFGRLQRLVEPGLHWKWPWPIERVYTYAVNHLQTLNLGFEEEKHEEEGHKETGHQHALLYTKPHFHKEHNFLIAQKSEENEAYGQSVAVNLMVLNVLLGYRVNNLYKYLEYRNPKELLEGIGYRELTQFLTSMPMESVLGAKRLESAQIVKTNMQNTCEKLGMGIEIVFLGICGAHPPVPVADVFEEVIGATEQRETKILEARTYQEQSLFLVQGDIRKIELDAKIYLQRKELLTATDAEAFANFAKAYATGKNIYLERKYLKVLENYLPGKRIYLLHMSNPGAEVTLFNLEVPFTTDLLQLDFSEEKEAKAP